MSRQFSQQAPAAQPRRLNNAPAANGSVMNHNGASHSNNGSASPGASSNNLYQQLIDSSDLVKELDDIEAISQQISQHAEVLYQNWKSNSQPRQTTVSTSNKADLQRWKSLSANCCLEKVFCEDLVRVC